ncbi:uncharacterized protein [Nicotiana sylvestris]|uniref:uncharacterized protein n=1 Tax=Nicotiana sylvestris TaxID=4096 RepID=UPI00388CB64F
MPPNELNATSSSWPFAACGLDIIGPIEPTFSNEHRFILVAIDYFTKWVEAASYKVVTKKVVTDFVKDRIVCQFAVPKSIITDNVANLNIDLMKAIPEVEILSLRVIQEVELSEAEWIRGHYEQLALIDGKRINAVCHGQLYQKECP